MRLTRRPPSVALVILAIGLFVILAPTQQALGASCTDTTPAACGNCALGDVGKLIVQRTGPGTGTGTLSCNAKELLQCEISAATTTKCGPVQTKGIQDAGAMTCTAQGPVTATCSVGPNNPAKVPAAGPSGIALLVVVFGGGGLLLIRRRNAGHEASRG